MPNAELSMRMRVASSDMNLKMIQIIWWWLQGIVQKNKMVGGGGLIADPNGAEVAQEFPAL